MTDDKPSAEAMEIENALALNVSNGGKGYPKETERLADQLKILLNPYHYDHVLALIHVRDERIRAETFEIADALSNTARDAAVRRAVEKERERWRQTIMAMRFPNDNPDERRLDDVIAALNGKEAADDPAK